MDVLPAHLYRDSFRDSFKGFVALEIIIDLPLGFPINNIISLFGDLTIDANSQSAVASQLRRHIHDVIMACDGPSVLLTSEHVIPVLIEHKLLASTLRACDSVSTQKWDGRSEHLKEKIYPISPVKRVACRCGRKLAKKASGIQVKCHAFSLREGSA